MGNQGNTWSNGESGATTKNVVAFPGSNVKRSTAFITEAEPAPREIDLEAIFAGAGIGAQYQPQVDLRSGEVVGIESLLRIRDPKGHLLCTGEVVAAAEQAGYIEEVGHRMLRIACADFARLRRASRAPQRVAVNLSPLELRQSNYAEFVVQAVTEAGIDFSDLELEITEGWSLNDPSLHLQQLVELADLGVSLAIDDFGAGHAAWAHVLKLPINTLKIDRSLIADIARDPRAAAVVKSICATCEDLDLNVVAEGVCQSAQTRLLLEMNCGIGQGFGIARPMPLEDMLQIKPLTVAC